MNAEIERSKPSSEEENLGVGCLRESTERTQKSGVA
jgi:hypothetical protein